MSTAQDICCDSLTIVRAGREVVTAVNTSIAPNDSIAIIGPNGAGKSSLMLALLGLLRPSAGRVVADGRDVWSIPARQRAARFAYVPQLSGPLPPLTVRDVVATGIFPRLGWLQRFQPESKAAVDRALEDCGLNEIATRDIRRVSAGERQKALIASAIVQDAAMMFLDEPDAALDPGYEVGLARALRGWRDRGRGLVLITHDMGFAGAVCRRVLAMRDGRIAAEGAAETILTPDRLAALFGSMFEVATTATGRRVVVSAWT